VKNLGSHQPKREIGKKLDLIINHVYLTMDHLQWIASYYRRVIVIINTVLTHRMNNILHRSGFKDKINDSKGLNGIAVGEFINLLASNIVCSPEDQSIKRS
jgi:hypothetical protein